MLVLSRKQAESIVIGNDIRITIERIKGNRVVVGIAASDDVPILRGELIADIQRRKSESSEHGNSSASSPNIAAYPA
ncbi:carbon storage regulator [Planctomycetes bacterium K23_9]|uniref:Translational regulator CsrA n=1 Tax=Stieleria marina TaxID=1930275 RepID=A0A517NXX8_9BACT|nr:hypothetical protein K239x_39580 [Planctomycetes bacterium K23_9]